MKELSEYELDKQKRKQLQVRNEFLHANEYSSKYEFPIIKKQEIDIDKIEFLSYTDAKIKDEENKHKTIHFFTYDWKFEKVYDKPEDELEKLSQYYCLLSPDFSMWINMPVALQIESVFKNRWCGAYWQSKGLKVIPTVSWGDERSFDFCFEGIEQGSIVAVCTYYRESCEEEFMLGYKEMLKRIKPSAIICYDEAFPAMEGNVYTFLPTTFEWIKDLSEEEQKQFMWEKHNKNILGLDPKKFKYFKYEDGHARKYFEKCHCCGNIVLVSEYGNGDNCDKCGWQQTRIDYDFPDRVQCPNMVSLNKAKKLFSEGNPLVPDIDDFISALNMYSETQFEYNNDMWYVYKQNKKIVLYKEDGSVKQLFDSAEDFKNKATINDKKLTQIWKDVVNADYLNG